MSPMGIFSAHTQLGSLPAPITSCLLPKSRDLVTTVIVKGSSESSPERLAAEMKSGEIDATKRLAIAANVPVK